MYIVATISKNSYEADKVREIIEAGATILRYNFSHGTPAQMREKVETARKVIRELGKEKSVKIMADLPGGKVRLGEFMPTEFAVKSGQEVIFRSAQSSPDPNAYIPVDHPRIGKSVLVGQEISCADGELGFTVSKIIDGDSFAAKAINSRHIPSLKALNVGNVMDGLDHLTPKTIDHIKGLVEIVPELVAFSFVNSEKYLKRARKLLSKHCPGLNAGIVSKVETENAIRNIRGIVAQSDYVLIARGDLGLTVPLERLGIYQKMFVRAAKKAGKQSIVSTQILDSILNQYVPSRAEVLDLTNIVLDGADGIMLAKETGISLTPAHSVRTARKIIDYVKANRRRIEA